MKKYFSVQAIIILTLLISINVVYTEGEKQLDADRKWEISHTKEANNDNTYAGICNKQYNYIEEYESAKVQSSTAQTKKEMAYVERLEIARVQQEQINREQLIIETCKKYVGKIKYNFGMKPTYDGWSIDNGLDCSGFAEFIYQECGLKTKECIESTLTTYLECKEISHEELVVGYLGMVNTGGSYYEDSFGDTNYTGDFNGDGKIDDGVKLHSNHVGIYLGVNENGNDIWCHCNAKDGTVVIGEYPSFKYFYAVTVED